MKFDFYGFDAYGTLFDIHSAVARHRELVGPMADRVSEVWRNKQLEYSWTRNSMGQYREFWLLTEQALDFALATVPGANVDAKKQLLGAYETLDCYDDVAGVLTKLQSNGAKTAILSNGSPAMLESAVNHAGIADLLDEVISVDPIKTYKATQTVYALIANSFGVRPEEISFQSSNRWDIAGAKTFGFYCQWINRTGQPDEYLDLSPDEVHTDMTGLVGS
ncbi:MAG: haloacid dehalogenase type II [Gammaproteobacteria bacterium]|nr:haloacid dehalogenase type II [Gammaproteobacteria bacterium]